MITSEEKMRKAFEAHQLSRYQYADITRDTDGRYLNDPMESEWETWQAALQESAAGAVAYILRNEYDEYRPEPLDGLNIKQFPVEQEIKLYPAPPSAPAIETAAYMRAAEYCDELAKLYPREDVGFDKGYSMCATRAANELRRMAESDKTTMEGEN